MNLCPECSEPLDDFAPCACVFGQRRDAGGAVPDGSVARQATPARVVDVVASRAFRGSMRAKAERRWGKVH